MTDEMGDGGSVETGGGAAGEASAPPAGGEGPNVGGEAGAAGEAVESAGSADRRGTSLEEAGDDQRQSSEVAAEDRRQDAADRDVGGEDADGAIDDSGGAAGDQSIASAAALQYDLPLDYTQKPHRPEVQELLDEVETLNVSTGRNQVVLYSGPGNRYLAESYAKQTGRMLIDETSGGKRLAEQRLYENVYDPVANPKGLTHSEANLIWSRLSQRYVEQASGSVSCWVTGSRVDNVFWSTELATLERNDKVTKVNFLK